MTPTLLKTSWRYLLRHPWQIGLAILGVALGVAVVVSIDLTNSSARRAFAISTETIAGRATHQIVGGPNGLDEAIYRRLRVDLGLRDSAPLVEGYAAVPGKPGLTLHILGVDPLAEGPFRPYLSSANAGPNSQLTALFTTPGAALMSAETARVYGLKSGDTLSLRVGARTQSATLIALLEPQDEAARRASDSLLIVDIATAQEWLGMLGRLSQIDLILPEGAAAQPALDQVGALLPQGLRVTRPALRTQAIEQMTAAFELNLTALSLLALMVGMFLIYNTITFSVVQRRSLIGSLRCLGVSRRQIFALVLGEALLVGVVGALAGLLLGIGLGRGLIRLVTQTINDLYFTVSINNVEISAGPLIKGFLLGLGTTLVAAAVPAVEATLTPPRTVLRRSSYEERVRRYVPIAGAAGLALLLGGGALLLIPSKSIVLSFSALLILTLGAAAVTPMAVLLMMQLARLPMGWLFGLLGRMAARDVVATLSRTSVAIAALMIAVSVTIGVGLMVGSFRQTVVSWLDSTLRADVFVSVPGVSSNRLDAPLPDAIVGQIAAAPGVERVRRYRSVTVEGQFGPQLLVALEVATDRDRASFQFLQGQPASAWPGFAQGQVLVSEPLAFRYDLAPGDTLRLLTEAGEREFTIAAVYADYGSDQGVVMIDLARYQALWNDPRISSLGVYAAPGTDVDALVLQLRGLAGADQIVNIRSNRALREASIDIFDRTFAITTVLQLLATIVAFIGILAALMALQLERARELGMLRANGLTPRQLWGVVISQTGLIGFTAGLLSLPVGVMLAAVLVYVINKRSFGWTLLFRLDGGLFAQAMLVAIAAALLAGLYPAWRMSRTPPALALREE
ncbi:MAG TPA: ABC transporter permease [Kouleothrix sp.]|uniref:FtsX-like permease family protein n=1 Tax=Kouleothrix sp. TaxID=2779161 RepID=UPI002C59A2FA|nr:ABC transporter permease [Kouleothrix sp.]